MDLTEFKTAIKDRDSGIAPETVALIEPVADRTNTIYGGVTFTTLTSVAEAFPFAKETQAFIKGNAVILETIAPEPEGE